MEKKKIAKITRFKTDLYGPEIKEQDRKDSLVGLMEEIAARRDYWANINGKETAVRWSFCVGGDTQILTNKGYIKASDVETLKNEEVKLWNGETFVSKKSWINSGKQKSVQICFSDGSMLIASNNHPFRIKGNPVFAEDVKPGMFLDVNQKMPEQIWSEDIYELGKKAQISQIPVSSYQPFLKGLLDFHSEVEDGNLVFNLGNLTEANEVILMLQALGLYASLGGNHVKRVNRVYLTKYSTQQSLAILGSRNTDILKEIIKENTSIEYNRDFKIVSEVNDLGEREVFGPVDVDGGWYVTEGLISHNTPFTAKNQCLGPDEYILSSKGLVKMSDISLFEEDTKIWNGSKFVNKEKWTVTKNTPALKIRFKDNDEIIASLNHPFKSKGTTVLAENLKVNDLIDFSYSKFPQAEFSERFYLIGLLRDACINTSNEKVNKIYFTNEPADGNLYIINTLEALGIKWSINSINNKERVAIGYDEEIKKIEGLVFKDLRFNRHIQKIVLQSPQHFASYLSGAFDADGSIVYSRGTYTIRISQSSKELAIQTQRILQFLGIDSSLQETKRIPNSKFDIRIKGGYEARVILNKILNLKIKRKRDLLNESVSHKPKTGKPGKNKIIKSIERVVSDVYGPLHLEGKWYISNGLYSHNTPLEYSDCMGGLTNKKTLTPAVEASRRLGFKFRVGTAQEISTIAQVLTLGDRRLNKVIYRAYKEGILQYFGGMSVGKDILEPFAQLLMEETGHTYETYAQEKSLFQAFPWDFIDLGMTKEYRKERYLQSKNASLSDFSCFTHCASCGACQTSQLNLPRIKQKDVTQEFEVL